VFSRSLALALPRKVLRTSRGPLAVATAVAILLLVPSTQAAPAADDFPVTVFAANGKVTIQKKPRRIVSISPTATESLFAIGAGSQVVAVDDQSNYPRTAPRTRLSGFTPNAEAIAKYRPDLVIVSFDANRVVASLKKLRIPVMLQPAARTLPQAYEQIKQLGRATGHALAARSLVARMRTRIAEVVAASTERARGVSFYHELSPDYYSATSKTFIGTVYALFGLRNIADAADSSGSGYPQLAGEYVIAANPGLIVLADTTCCAQTKATVAARPGWDRIRAVRTGAIVLLDDSIASRWGPRIVNFVRAVSSALRTTVGT
jgi:iron complex transport system substrate-binding protein